MLRFRDQKVSANEVEQSRSNSQVAARFFQFGRSFWSGETARKAWFLVLGLIAATLALVGFVVLINRWMASFFDAIERRDMTALLAGLAEIAILGGAAALSSGTVTWSKQSLQIDWREFLTRRLLARWVALGSAHHVQAYGQDVDMPEFRIAEDVRMAVDSLVEFATSMLNASISAAAFIVVLWSVGGSIRIPVGGGGVEIPGYMVWLAVVYSILLSGGISLLGRPLVRASERKNAAEASLRADMMELGQIPVSVSLRHGDELQRRHVVRDIELLFGRWRRIALYQS